MNEVRHDLYTVELIEGLSVSNARTSKPIVYKRVILREAREADIHNAIRKVERAVKTPEGWKLLFNETMYDYQRMCEQIVKFTGATGSSKDIDAENIDLEMISKLHPLDVARIQEHLGLIEVSAQARFGLITQEEADILLSINRLQAKKLTPHEILDAIQLMKNAVAKATGTSLVELEQMPLAQLQAAVQKLHIEK